MDQLQIEILDDIGGWGFNLKTLINKLRGFKGSKITVPINSFGGSVLDGLAIYNTLKGRSETVETSVVGYAISMGSVLLAAGDRRTMPEQSYLMIHNPWSVSVGDADDMEGAREMLAKMKDSLLDIYMSVAKGVTREEVSAMMDAETWINAEDALKYGFITDITKGVEFKASLDPEQLNVFSNAPEELINKFSQSKFNKMDIKSFLSKIIPGLKNKFNLNLETEASPEDVIQELENSKSFEDLKAEITADIKNSFKPQNPEGYEELKTKVEELSNSIQSQETKLEEAKTEIANRKDQIANLEGELAKMKGNKGGDPRNTTTPPSTLETSNVFMNNLQSASPDGKSKY